MLRRGLRHPAAQGWLLNLMAVGVASFCLLVFAHAMSNNSYNVWGALIVAPVITGLSIALVTRLRRYETDPRIARLLGWAIAVKLLASLARYYVSFVVYDGAADAAEYDRWGQQLAPSFRNFDFIVDVGRPLVGTGFLRAFTGVIYAVIGPTLLGGFIVFSFIGFIGLYLFHRGFTLACPTGDHYLYAKLVFFMPSLVFWPSSIGKDAWMLLTLGLTAYGAARSFRMLHGGYPLVGLGLIGASLVRPHVALLVFCAIAVAFLARRSRGSVRVGAVQRVVGIALIVLVGSIMLVRVEQFFGLDRLDSQSLETVLNNTNERSSVGGSEYEATVALSPAKVPWAIVTVLLRPFPYEADNAQALIASAEGLVLLGLLVHFRKRLAAVPRMLTSQPYVTMAALYSLGFSITFASVGNFGIISRQRAQLLPFLFVLMAARALPSVKRRAKERAEPASRSVLA